MNKAQELLKIMEAQGQGTGREQTGGTDTCVCTKCGYTEPHNRGVPCNNIMCPKCNIPLTGLGTKGSKIT